MDAWSLTGSPTPPDGAAEGALTVSQASELACGALRGISTIAILGEVTGFRGPNQGSGHCYFQIKDDQAALEVIVWKHVYAKRQFDLRNGLQVLFTGTFDVYKNTGKMSFKASSFTLAGEGLLRQQVAELSERLAREGLMDESRKRPIPVFCTRVAVVTSLSGAVINDVKRTLRRRNRLVELICVGSKVQGEGAPAELIDGLRRAAAITPAPDCILLVRGGGSYEDLMTFNDEALARAVADCPIPVVTGIGHEPDTSICDLVGDRRCSTPTAAAESVAPAFSELVAKFSERELRLKTFAESLMGEISGELESARERLSGAMARRLERLRTEVEHAASRPCLTAPTSTIDLRAEALAQTSDRFVLACEHDLRRHATSFERLSPRLMAASSGISAYGHALDLAASRLASRGAVMLEPYRSAQARDAASLEALSPLKVLSRGYSIAFDGSGRVATTVSSFAEGDEVRVRMSDGDVVGVVSSISPSA